MLSHVKDRKSRYSTGPETSSTTRIQWLFLIFVAMVAVVICRLFFLMIINYDFYKKLAYGAQELYAQLYPKRGEIFARDSRTGEKFPLALNKDIYLMFADTRRIQTDEEAKNIVDKLSELFLYDDSKKSELILSLNKRTDPYEPIEKKIENDMMEKVKALKLPGIEFTKIPARTYPEGRLAAQVVGFVNKDENDQDVGRYGIEGYWQTELAGKGGILSGLRSAKGRWIPFDTSLFDSQKAEDGTDLVLTIDRTVQYTACERLRQGMFEYGASSASLVIMEPKTGAILSMCSLPDFDPNVFGAVKNADAYNNTTIFTPYEPGSIFKPITMAAAINEELVNPQTYFYDPGVRTDVCSTPIRNAESKVYKDTNMTGVLEDSINTGMIFVAEQLGTNRFRDYIEKFGFGFKGGVELDTESSGNINSLSKNKKEKIDCYTATGSFGQGLTVTPLQMVTAYSAIANGGILMKPYIIDEFLTNDNKSTKTKPKEIRRVMSERAASLLTGMLVNVVENGHAKYARMDNYYIGGKTGTAQIPGPGGYTDETIHSFVGFAPIDNPKFVMIVKYEKPARKYAESTAVPVFADITKFLLQYYKINPER